MQDLPIFFLFHKSMRFGMCRMFASLQYSDFASADSASVISRLSVEITQWTGIHQSVEKSLDAGPLADFLGKRLWASLPIWRTIETEAPIFPFGYQ